MCFLTVVGAGSPESGCWQGWFLVRPLSSLYLHSHCVLSWPLCVHAPGEPSSSYLGTSPIQLGTYPYNLIKQNYLLKGPVPIYSHIGG